VAYVIQKVDFAWILSFEIVPDASWLEVVPTVLRHILSAVDACGEVEKRETYVALELGPDHPAYRAMPDVLNTPPKGYALYMRVPDLPAFITHIASVLEQRLNGSVARGYSGELPINFYRGGIRLVFKDGKLVSVVAERLDAEVAASLPDLTFLQLLFGYRSLAELDAWYPDCRIRTNEARVLLDALFPKQPSFVWPVW
ncbi:MAG: sterol carrier protein domain-containing protein, partial [Chloroflexota bacterium]|nr:sterol carrier protein domain-containing protein [Chloroflexota bacterium]